MTIHTLECTAILTRKKYYRLCNKIKKLDPAKWKADSQNSMFSWALQNFGIRIYFKRVLQKNCAFYYITFRLSPTRLLDCNNFIDLIRATEIPEYLKMANHLLQAISTDFPKLETTIPSRVDFAFNYSVGDEFDAKNYIKILHRGIVPKGFTLGGNYDNVAKRWKSYRSSFQLETTGIKLLIYDKHSQMISQKPGTFPEYEISR